MAEFLTNLDFSFVWLILLIVFVVIEATTINLVCIWFSVGSLFALVATISGAQLWLQVVIFILVSTLSLILTRPLVKKLLLPKRELTNFDRIIGQTAVVTEVIDNINGTGYVYIDGKPWMARSENGEVFEKEMLVLVEKIEGVKVIVKKMQ